MNNVDLATHSTALHTELEVSSVAAHGNDDKDGATCSWKGFEGGHRWGEMDLWALLWVVRRFEL